MKQPRRWTIAPQQDRARALAEDLGTSELVARMLLNRGHAEPAACEAFLRPTLKLLHDPNLIPGLPKAAERLAKAVRDREKIVLYGDYDVDGITAVSILWHALTLLGGVVDSYIPHRVEEGYGLNAHALEKICADGAKVIVTVDCGITALEPAKVCAARGVDLVITDHHEWKEGVGGQQSAVGSEEGTGDVDARSSADSSSPPTADRRPPTVLLPAAYAVVHPRLPSDGPAYPNPHLCGAGVAFKVAWGVGQALAGGAGGKVGDALRGFLVDATALAALGTIADVVPLVGENRVLAHFGLGGLKASRLCGIQALIASANLTDKKLDSYHVGFLLAPRLNASGRMGHATLAVEMLTTATPERALEIAEYLEAQNRLRQQTERDILAAALGQVEQRGYQKNASRGIVVGDAAWHPGVIGIVAARLVDRFHRPTVVVALNEAIGQGSGRSIDGFHLASALKTCGEYLESHGGHEMAAGLKIRPEKFEDFRAAFVEHAGTAVGDDLLTPVLRLDADAKLPQANESLVHEMKRLGPFGRGNPKPLLRWQNLVVANLPRRVGKTGDHLQLQLRQGQSLIKAIAFGAGDWFDKLTPGTTVHVAAEPTLNEWNGRVSVELEVKDIQLDG